MTSWKDLYKLRIRESEKLKTVLELFNMEIHQKKAGPDCHRLKTMVKRSIKQNLRIKNFEARNGNYERNAVVKNQGTKQRGQGDGVPKACAEQAAADPRGSRTCVCASTFFVPGVAHAGKEGRMNILPWYRLDGVAIPPVSRTRLENRAARGSQWPPRGTGTTVLTCPCPSQPCFGGSKGAPG